MKYDERLESLKQSRLCNDIFYTDSAVIAIMKLALTNLTWFHCIFHESLVLTFQTLCIIPNIEANLLGFLMALTLKNLLHTGGDI